MPRLRFNWWLPFALVWLVGTGYLGISNAFHEYAGATNLGQRLATVSELAYGVLGVLGSVTLLAAHPLTRPVVLAWAVAVTVTSAFAAWFWGEAGLEATLLAGAGAAVIAWLVVWLTRRALAAGISVTR